MLKPHNTALEPSSEERVQLMEAVNRRLEAFLEAQAELPMVEPSPRGEPMLHQRFPPHSSSSIDELCEHLFEKVIPPGLNTAGPGHFAFVPGGGLYSAALGGLIGSVVNKFVGSLTAAPGAAALERETAEGLAHWLGVPEHTGIFTSGGSMSALAALCAARDKLAPEKFARATIYFSEQTHFSFSKAAHLVGIPKLNMRRIGTNANHQVDLVELTQRIEVDCRMGLTPLCLCGNAGTASVGVVDPLDALADIAEQVGAWFHVDGAYGGFFATLPELEKLFAGMNRADSIVIDPHKGMFLGYGTGLLLVKELAVLRNAHGTFAGGSSELEEPFELSPELSRSWRGLRVWLPLMLHGRKSFEDAWRQRRSWSLKLWEQLGNYSVFERTEEPELSLFGFRLKPDGVQSNDLDKLNLMLLEMLNATGRVVFSGTHIKGAYFLRVCVMHLRTDAHRVEEAGEWIVTETARLMALLQSETADKDALLAREGIIG